MFSSFFSPVEEHPVYTPVTFDLSEDMPLAALEGPLHVTGWVFAPPHVPDKPVVLVLLPGGSYTKAYWHLQVPGYAVDAYSCARALADKGMIVVALDHLGVGESSRPDGMLLTLEVMAAANAIVTRQIQVCLASGSLSDDLPPLEKPVMIGVGHSMGAYLLLEQQANECSFQAIALLGYANRPIVFDSGVIDGLFQNVTGGYTPMDRGALQAFFYASDVPARVIETDAAVASSWPLACVTDILQPGRMMPKAATVMTPVFLANGEVDLAQAFREEAAMYPAVRDLTLFELAGSAHCHNFATTRHLLWDRLALWCQAQTA